MEIKNLFDEVVYHETVARINRLHGASPRNWGKMTVSQMLQHCQEVFKVPLSSKKLQRHPIGILFGWMMKASLYNEKPWKKNLPTARNLVIKDDPAFDGAQANLLSIMEAFYKKGAAGVGDKMHPMFGRLTAEQWGKSIWKHLNHHLTQFGV